MKLPCLAALLALTCLANGQMPAVQPAPEDSETVLTDPVFWEKGPTAFSSFFSDAGFHWTSTRKETLRATAAGSHFADLPVVETLIWFKDGRPSEVTLSLYNRGDSGPISESAFLALLKSAQTKLATQAHASATDTAPSLFKGFPPKRQIWKLRNLALVMEWDRSLKTGGDSNFQAEYLRVRLLPAQQLGSGAADKQVSAFATSQKQVTTLENGDVYLADVPMVDQGPKGYCAVAATERVLRYYGAIFDQHQLAQIAGTEAGTDTTALSKALQRSATKLRIAVTEIEEFSVDGFLNLIRNYNGLAKRAKKPEIELPRSGVIDVQTIYDSMDRDLLIEARTKNPTAMNKFEDRVAFHIKNRTPLIWGVMLGLFPEPDIPQASGGHLRLIIGFNAKTRELLYSDSWGAGHELKRMPLAQAYAISTSLFAIRPK